MAGLDIFSGSQKLMTMSDATWSKHANPWSVYSRVLGGTFVFFALWSPFWIGYWGIAAILLAAAWTWLNPRLFSAPHDTSAWATKGVLGERAFLLRKETPVPRHHEIAAFTASSIAGAFLFIAVLGFVSQDFWLACVAWHAATVAKLWFCDRMVWLWADMRSATEQYRAWDAAKW